MRLQKGVENVENWPGNGNVVINGKQVLLSSNPDSFFSAFP